MRTTVNFQVTQQMDDIRHLFKDTLDEAALNYIELSMECAVRSAIVDHIETNNKILRDMSSETNA